MKFLFLTREDCAGVAHKLKAAADSLPDHSAHSVSLYRTRLCYPEDVFRPSDAMLRELREWADAIVMFDGWNRTLEIKSGRQLAVVYNGSGYRSAWRHRNEQDRENGIVQFGTTIDLACATYGSSLNWLPVPMEIVNRAPEKTEGVFHVIHCPTHRGRKSTERIIEELDDLDGVRLEIVEGATNAECLRRKAKAHLLIDQFYVGYGVNALEAWSLGMPVVGGCRRLPGKYGVECPGKSEIVERVIEMTRNEFPFADADIDIGGDLRLTVEALMIGSSARARLAELGAAYLREFHSVEAVIGRLVSALEKGVQ